MSQKSASGTVQIRVKYLGNDYVWFSHSEYIFFIADLPYVVTSKSDFSKYQTHPKNGKIFYVFIMCFRAF